MNAAVWLAGITGLLMGVSLSSFFFFSKIRLSGQRLKESQDNLLREQTTSAKLQGEFRLAAVDALKDTQEQFFHNFRQAKTENDMTMSNNKSLIETSVQEMKSKLEDSQKLLRHFEEERHQMYGKLDRSLSQVLNAENLIRIETGALKKALTSSSGVRGKWGERILEEIFEQNDMIRGINFDAQVSLEGDDSADVRPDFVIYLPGGKRLAVDSKEVTGEYLLAQETEDPDKQKEHYDRLVVNIRNNFTKLGRKDYQKLVDKEVPFVVMFIPSEAAIRAAFATDPGIFQEATAKRVILASPMTIIPLIHLIKHSWEKQKLADNALELGNSVEVLGNYLHRFLEHLNNVRAGLKKAVEGWNDAAASWQSRVTPQIEKTKSLGGKLRDAEEPLPVETNLRRALETSRTNSE